jgi:sugar O-acyltransferase (sialic acid O-acetyltransferase NeuD family)
LLGAGGHARACIDVLERIRDYRPVGLVGLDSERGTSVFDYPVLGTDEDLRELLHSHPVALVTIGQIKSAATRMRLFGAIVAYGRPVPAIVSPLAYVSRHARLGAGTIVMHGAIVNAGASVGQNCIVNSKALVEHDASVADHCHVSTGAILNSGVTVGEGSFIGSAASVRQGIAIGRGCVIGMGEAVRVDCGDGLQRPGRKEEA